MGLMKKYVLFVCAALALLAAPQFAFAADVNGADLALWWGIPFAATLLSIAIFPVAAPLFWHHHYGKVIAVWAVCFLVPFTFFFGFDAALHGAVHALVAEYIPFILLLLALFVVAGGIYVRTDLRATPKVNVAFLALGAVLASMMGTTGASMLLIRPMLRANEHRQKRAHLMVFFIFLVSNIGGALTPLGDPPLFLGFLQGVSFFWTLQYLWPQFLFLVVLLLILFYVLDSWLLRKELQQGTVKAVDMNVQGKEGFAIEGKVNFLLLLGVVGLVMLSGIWKSEQTFDVFGTTVTLPGLVRDVGFIVIVFLSLGLTSKGVRRSNAFTWGPIVEVAKLFAGIFLTIIPVIAMLKAGQSGAFSPVVSAVTNSEGESIPMMYFWATGILSSFLDNAPTYLVFFNTAGGDAATLMTTMAPTLMAISAGAVFMGANTYIGNAPNLMVKAIAEERGVNMPSFFGYMAWSFGILVPSFVLITLIWYI